MARWECAIEGDGASFDRVEDLIVHQATEHERPAAFQPVRVLAEADA